jgi:hypothetical protein
MTQSSVLPPEAGSPLAESGDLIGSPQSSAGPQSSGGPLPALRPYQLEAGRAILRSVRRRLGLTFSVEIARQGGKNELSAQIELLLLLWGRDGDLIKCAPTLAPQGRISLERLWLRLQDAGLVPPAQREGANAIRLGRARQLILSAAKESNVVGHTAGLLLEVDEAQDVEREKFDRDFRPMAAGGATIVFYGTAWDAFGLLEEQKQHHLDLERQDGIRRHFEYPWEVVAHSNPSYARFVAAERERLGQDHPLFLTQYCLRPISGSGRLFTDAQRALLRGSHQRQRQPGPADRRATFVAGLDVGGQALEPSRREPDATVLTIVRCRDAGVGLRVSGVEDDGAVTGNWQLATGEHGADACSSADDGNTNAHGWTRPAESPGPEIEIVEHYVWRGEAQDELARSLIRLLRDLWRVRRVAVDATGIGEGLAAALTAQLGRSRVLRLRFSTEVKSRLGFGLLAAAGRLHCYAADGSEEYRAFWRELELARAVYRPNRTMNFLVEPSDGHDDYLISLALAVEAVAAGGGSRVARGHPSTGSG